MRVTGRAAPWARWLLAACTLLLAALLIWQCADIYRVGTSPENLTETGVPINDMYTREGVGQRLRAISWAFWLWLAALAAAVVLGLAAPAPQAALKPSPEARLRLMAARRDKTPAMLREERLRRLCAWGCGAVCLLCAALIAAYLLDFSHFESRDLETVIGAMSLYVGPFVLLALAALMAFAQIRHMSLLRELAAAKEAPARAAPPAPQNKPTRTPILRVALYLAALALVVAGILNGGMYDVLVKAVNICTECIGLG